MDKTVQTAQEQPSQVTKQKGVSRQTQGSCGQEPATIAKPMVSRRSFLSGAAALGASLAAVGLSGCAQPKAAAERPAQATESTQENWWGSPSDEASFNITEELETDILVCGCGHAGMTAALAAAQTGASVLVIEKTATYGIFRTFPGAVGSRIQHAAGVDIDKLELSNEIMRYASGRANQDIVNLWINESGEWLDWFTELIEPEGVYLTAEPDVGDGWHGSYRAWPTSLVEHIPEERADHAAATPSMGPILVDLAQKMGADFRYNTELVQFIKEGDRVVGCIAKTGSSYIRIKASRGTLLCTGGYEGNAELMQKLNPAASSTVTCAQYMLQNDGAGMKAGIWTGGVKDGNPTAMLFDRGGIAPGLEAGFPVQGQLFWMGSQPFLKVNTQGKRIGNEDVPYDSMIASASLQKDHLWCSIWDANYQEDIKTFHTLCCSRIDPSPTPDSWSFTYEAIAGMNEGLKAQGIIFECDTLEELAEKLQIPVDDFMQTVQEYNALCESGKDTHFGKASKDMRPLTTPPYSGCRVGSALLCTLDGLRIDTDCHLLSENGTPISGLWAAGNCTGGFFSDNYPELIPGVASGRTATQARHAVLNMLGLK